MTTNQETRTVMTDAEAIAFNDGWKRGEAYGRKQALKEAANVAAVVLRARGTALEVAEAVYALREGDK